MEKPSDFDEISLKNTKKLTYEYVEKIGINIKSLRQKNNLTQADVAFYIFSDKSLISSLERGRLKNITLFTIIKLSELFNISVEELLNEG